MQKIINPLTFKQGYYPGLSGWIQYSPMRKKIKECLWEVHPKRKMRDTAERGSQRNSKQEKGSDVHHCWLRCGGPCARTGKGLEELQANPSWQPARKSWFSNHKELDSANNLNEFGSRPILKVWISISVLRSASAPTFPLPQTSISFFLTA